MNIMTPNNLLLVNAENLLLKHLHMTHKCAMLTVWPKYEDYLILHYFSIIVFANSLHTSFIVALSVICPDFRTLMKSSIKENNFTLFYNIIIAYCSGK